MSTGRRLAKRSIIGTKVCAPGPDGLWYSGVIQDVKTPPSSSSSLSPSSSSSSPPSSTSLGADTSGQTSSDEHHCVVGLGAGSGVPSTNITTPDTIYLVRFDFKTQNQPLPMDNTKNTVIIDARQHHQQQNRVAAALHISPAQSVRRNAMIKEFRETDLIGPGFRSIMGVQLHPGQRVFLTYNGRETSADVITHDLAKDEVMVKIAVAGNEEPIELKKRLEEVRLLESRRSARLADQDRDTDFARLADMGGDRRRTSHSIDVPLPLTPQHNSRKRRPSSSQEDHENFLTQFRNDDEMNACNAALVLMSLSCSPLSPKNADKWTILGSSPGSSSASWSSGSSSPPLSDDGQITHSNTLNDAASSRIRTTSLSTSDEGIVMDYNEDAPRKRRAHRPIFKCTWKGCDFLENTAEKIERHIRNAHIGHKKARHSVECDGSFSESDHEEEFYYTEIEDDDDEGKSPSPPSPPTLSHRDMARPPHEDPEYQRQIVGNFKNRHGLAQSHSANGRSVHQQQLHNSNHHHHINANHHHGIINSAANNAGSIPTSPLAHHNYTWSPSSSSSSSCSSSGLPSSAIQHHSPVSPLKHARWSPRPSTSSAPYPFVHHHHHHQQHNHQQQHHQHHNYSHSSGNNSSGVNGVGTNSSNVINHSNNSANNNVLQQLSQQNITVTAHNNSPHHLTTHNATTSSPSTLSIPSNIPQTSSRQHQIHQHSYQIHQNQTLSPKAASATANNSNQSVVVAAGSSISVAMTAGAQHQASSTATGSQQNHHQQQQQQQHHQLQSAGVQHTVATNNRSPQSPNRRTRGENKKCRKVYGMEKRDQWCTQCKWKKACSRFGD